MKFLGFKKQVNVGDVGIYVCLWTVQEEDDDDDDDDDHEDMDLKPGKHTITLLGDMDEHD